MAEAKKKPTAKPTKANAKQTAKKVTKSAEEVFGKLKKHFEPQKVDEWQKKWLATPAAKKKYEKLSDAPEVVGDELSAMANDIVDFVQGQEGGKSSVFKKVKSSVGGFIKHPVGFLQEKASKGKEMAKKGAAQAKPSAKKTKKAPKK